MVVITAPNTFEQLNQIMLRRQPLVVELDQQRDHADGLELHLRLVRRRDVGIRRSAVGS